MFSSILAHTTLLQPEMECQYIFNVVLQGMQAVGKPQLFDHCLDKRFKLSSKPKAEANIGAKLIDLQGKKTLLQIWD